MNKNYEREDLIYSIISNILLVFAIIVVIISTILFIQEVRQ